MERQPESLLPRSVQQGISHQIETAQLSVIDKKMLIHPHYLVSHLEVGCSFLEIVEKPCRVMGIRRRRHKQPRCSAQTTQRRQDLKGEDEIFSFQDPGGIKENSRL